MAFCINDIDPVSPVFTDVFTAIINQQVYLPGKDTETFDLKDIGYETYITPQSDLVNEKLYGQVKNVTLISGSPFPILVTEN